MLSLLTECFVFFPFIFMLSHFASVLKVIFVLFSLLQLSPVLPHVLQHRARQEEPPVFCRRPVLATHGFQRRDVSSAVTAPERHAGPIKRLGYTIPLVIFQWCPLAAQRRAVKEP